MKISLFLFLFLVFLGCTTEEDCVEVTMIGTWTTFSTIKEENLNTGVEHVSADTFKLTFSENNYGYYNLDVNSNFIWGIQCNPELLLISEQVHSQDSLPLELYSTRVFTSDEKNTVTYMELFNSTLIGDVKTTTYWILAKE